MYSSLLATKDVPIVIRFGNPMHVQIFFSIPFGAGTLMSLTPYRKISLKQPMLTTVTGVCIRWSLRILYRTTMFMFYVLSWMF